MSMGGSQTQQTKIPAYLEDALRGNLARSDAASRIGFAPYFGPDVAAMTGQQTAAMGNNNMALSAFGMGAVDPMAGMPAPQSFGGGLQGYSSAPMYMDSLEALRAARPGQYDAITAMFVDPITGAAPRGVMDAAPSAVAPAPTPRRSSGGMVNGLPAAPTTTGMNTVGAYLPGGINTANPNSFINRVAAAATTRPTTITAAQRPMPAPWRT